MPINPDLRERLRRENRRALLNWPGVLFVLFYAVAVWLAAR